MIDFDVVLEVIVVLLMNFLMGLIVVGGFKFVFVMVVLCEVNVVKGFGNFL